MVENSHPHKKVIDNYENIYPMVTLIDESKTTYVREKLSLHLHAGEIKLLKETRKHSRPHHKALRINKYNNMKDSEKTNELFQLHIKLYIKKYKKLEAKGLVTVDTETNDLPFDVTLTEKGEETLKQIEEYEHEWEDVVLEGITDKEKFLEEVKIVANNALPINYKHKKQQKFVF